MRQRCLIALTCFSVLALLCHVAQLQTVDNTTGETPTNDYDYADYLNDIPNPSEATKKDEASTLGKFTRDLLEQKIGVYGQAIRISSVRFQDHRCQVVYLGSPDWSTLSVKVSFADGTASQCPPGRRPQAAFAFVDGYKVPKDITETTIVSGQAPWASVVVKAKNAAHAAAGARPPPSSTPQPPPGPTSDGSLKSKNPKNQQQSGTAGRHRHPLGSDFRQRVNGFTGIKIVTGRATFMSAYDNLRGTALATLLGTGHLMPGPEGPLSVPVMVSERESGAVAESSGFEEGVLLRLEPSGTDPLADATVLTDTGRTYWAPEEDCLRLMPASRPGAASGASSSANSGGSSYAGADPTVLNSVNVGGVPRQNSCFATQLVVYVYNPCVNSSSSITFDVGLGKSPPPATEGQPAAPPAAVLAAAPPDAVMAAASLGRAVGGFGLTTEQRVTQMLEGALIVQAANGSLNAAAGFAQVLVTYEPYGSCVRKGVDMLSDVSVQVMIFSALIFGWILVFLLLPSIYRLFFEFPFRLVVHGVRKMLGKYDELKPMRPGLHTRRSSVVSRWPRNPHLRAILDPVFRLRKYLLYAVITVHSSDGQSRWLQVCVISNVALCIAVAVYAPGISPPLEHFVPPLALQITRNADALAALQYFFDIVVFSTFMGTLGYLSMLANYNSPVNKYYRVQCIMSASFMLLQDLLVLLQIISLLAQWENLRPSWPYLPLVVFQLINLVAANVLQVVIFSRRHEQSNRALYDAYVAARVRAIEVQAEAEAAAAEAARAAVLEDASSSGSSSSSGNEDNAEDDSGGSALDPRMVRPVIVGKGEGQANGTGGHRHRRSLGEDGGAGVVDFRRHRRRAARQQQQQQEEEEQVQGAKHHEREEQLRQDDRGEQGSKGQEAATAKGRRVRHLATSAASAEQAQVATAEAGAQRQRSRGRDGHGDGGGSRSGPRLLSPRTSESRPGRPRETSDDEEEQAEEEQEEEADREKRLGGLVDTECEEDLDRVDSRSPIVAQGGTSGQANRRWPRWGRKPASAAAAAESGGTDKRRKARPRPYSTAADGDSSGEEEAGPGRTGEKDRTVVVRSPGGAGASARPRRRLLMDGPVGNGTGGSGPVAEGRETEPNSGSRERLIKDGGVGAPAPQASRHRQWDKVPSARAAAEGGQQNREHRRPQSASVARFTGEDEWGMQSVEMTSRGGGNDAEGEEAGPAAVVVSGGADFQRRLYSNDTTGEDGVPYYKRPYTGQPRQHAVPAGAPEPPASHVKDTRAAAPNGLGTADASVGGKAYKSTSRASGGRRPQSSDAAPDLSVGRQSSRLQMVTAEAGVPGKAPAPTSPLRPKALERVRSSMHSSFSRSGTEAYGSDAGRCGDGELEKKKGHGGEDGGGGGWMHLPAKLATMIWKRLRESPDFRYPAWLLAALLVSAYMVVFHFGRALIWSSEVSDCLIQPAPCLVNTLGKYFKFITTVLSRQSQAQVRDSMQQLLGTRDTLIDIARGATAVDADGLANPFYQIDQTEVLEFVQEELNARNVSIPDLVAGLVAGSLASMGIDDPSMVEGITSTLGPNLTATVESTLNNTIINIVDRTNERLNQNGQMQMRAFRFLNTTIFTVYNTLNVTVGYITKGLDIQTEIRTWQEGIRDRFRWTSVLGFTLGLMLGFSTLVQTAASFRRAVRQTARMRVARRIFRRLFDLDGSTVPGAELVVGTEESLLANRAHKTSISLVVFFFGVLMSTAVIQLYMVGVLFSVLLAFLTHPWTWSYLFPRIWLYLVAIAAVFVLNKFILIGYVGNAFLSNGDHIYRPAAWLAFTFIMSITNLVIGLLLAVYRIVLLLLTTVLSLGKLEVTIFTFFANLDLPHNSFLAGLHLHEAMSNFHDPIYLPGPRGAAHRRWRKLRETVRRLPPEKLRLLATLGRPKKVQEVLDHVVVDMQAAKALATGSVSLPQGQNDAAAPQSITAGNKILAAGSKALSAASRTLAVGSKPLSAGSKSLGAVSTAGAPAGAASRSGTSRLAAASGVNRGSVSMNGSRGVGASVSGSAEPEQRSSRGRSGSNGTAAPGAMGAPRSQAQAAKTAAADAAVVAAIAEGIATDSEEDGDGGEAQAADGGAAVRPKGRPGSAVAPQLGSPDAAAAGRGRRQPGSATRSAAHLASSSSSAAASPAARRGEPVRQSRRTAGVHTYRGEEEDEEGEGEDKDEDEDEDEDEQDQEEEDRAWEAGASRRRGVR